MRENLIHDRKKKDRLQRFLVSFEELTMKKTVGATLTLALLGCLMAAPAASYAVQNDPDTYIIESLEFDQADIRDVLKVMFRATGFNYTVAPDVQGVIQVSLKNVPFKTALRNVLNQANATWREEGNIFNIIRKPDPVAPQVTDQGGFGGGSGDSTDFPPITLINDPQLILDLLLGNTEATTETETSSFPVAMVVGLVAASVAAAVASVEAAAASEAVASVEAAADLAVVAHRRRRRWRRLRRRLLSQTHGMGVRGDS
jgi:type II secretory pathway component GspD/PulD (secretin)